MKRCREERGSKKTLTDKGVPGHVSAGPSIPALMSLLNTERKSEMEMTVRELMDKIYAQLTFEASCVVAEHQGEFPQLERALSSTMMALNVIAQGLVGNDLVRVTPKDENEVVIEPVEREATPGLYM